jgi:hypothetical protein
LEGTVGEAVKDGYKALKEMVSRWASGDVAELEKTPGSAGRQATIAEIIDAQSEDDQKSLRDLADALVVELKENAPAIGLDIGSLTALEAQLGYITVTSGTGARRGAGERDGAPWRGGRGLSRGVGGIRGIAFRSNGRRRR